MSRQRDQGTKLETAIARKANDRLGLLARRLAEAGVRDEGDVEIVTPDGGRVVLECKARAALSLHEAWAKARKKAPSDAHVAVVWKRLVRKVGNQRRTAAGPTLVAVPLDDYLDLLASSPGGNCG